jgi:hypothetical protein
LGFDAIKKQKPKGKTLLWLDIFTRSSSSIGTMMGTIDITMASMIGDTGTASSGVTAGTP